MENFNNFEPAPEQPKRVKEKSVYLLHLDGARIIILSALMIGILLTAFLVGMKYSGSPAEEDFPSDVATEQKDKGGDLLDSEKTSDSLSASDLDINSDNLTLPQEPAKEEAKSAQPVEDKVATAEPAKAPASDIIVSEKVEPVKAEPVKEVAVKREPKPVKVKVKVRETRVAAKPKAPVKTNKKVVEVSATEPEFRHEPQIIKKPAVKGGAAFAIQIASYDTRAKAQKEMSALKAKSYDAYIDTASVAGKSFYRVKIGPISDKKEAISMMRELQATPRYQESYVVVQ